MCAMRVRSISGDHKLEAGEYVRTVLPIEARDIFNGGPHAGQEIPVGTVLSSFLVRRADELSSGNWTTSVYAPSPESTNSSGDRMTLTRVIVDVAKSTFFQLRQRVHQRPHLRVLM